MSYSVDNLMRNGKFSEALEILKNDQDIDSLIIKSVIHERLGNYKISLKLAEKVYAQTIDEPKSLIHIRSLVNKAYAYWRLENREMAFQCIEMGLQNINQLNDEFIRYTAELYYVRGILYYQNGDWERSEKDFENAYNLRIKYGDESLISHSLNALGILYESSGNIAKSLKIYHNALELKQKIGNKQDIARTLHNISMIYQIFGEYTKAKEYNNKGLEIAMQIKNNRDTAVFKLNNATLLSGENRIPEALDIAFDVLDIFRKDDYKIGQADTINVIINFLLQLKKYDEAKEYLGVLKELYENNPRNELHNIYQFSCAAIYKNGKRFSDRLKAYEIYKILLQNKTLSNIQKIDLRLDIIELQLEEYAFLRDNELLEEINASLKEIARITEKDNLIPQMVKNKVLQGEFEFYTGEYDIAKHLLTEAQIIGSQKKLGKIALYASDKFDSLFVKGFNEFTQKFDIQNLMNTIHNMKGNFNQLDFTRKSEIPITLLIIDKAGVMRFKYTFDTKFVIQEHLTASFISAIMAFSWELFGEKRQLINRIDHNEYSIYISDISDIQIAYIFKGNSYTALQKSLQLVNKVNQHEQLLQQLLNYPFDMDKNSQKELTNIIAKLFIKKM